MDKVIVSTPNELSSLIEASLKKVLGESALLHDDSNALPELLNISQASQYLSLAKQTIYSFTSKNEIPFIKRGKKLYFKKSELNKWLTEGSNKSFIFYTNEKGGSRD